MDSSRQNETKVEKIYKLVTSTDIRGHMEKLLTLKEAREILRVCNKTIQRWDKQGKIKCVRTPGNRRLIPESEILRILSGISPKIPEKREIEPIKAQKVEKKREETYKLKPKPKKPSLPAEVPRRVIIDALEPSGLALRTAFGDLLSAAAVLKRFSEKDLTTRARCPETISRLFCEKMMALGYIAGKNGYFELQVEVLR